MKLSIEPSVPAAANTTAESLALSFWYDSHPAIRRLWGIRVAQGLRVIVTIDPTVDDDDVLPVWLANTKAWSRELHLRTGHLVQLELIMPLPATESKSIATASSSRICSGEIRRYDRRSRLAVRDFEQ